VARVERHSLYLDLGLFLKVPKHEIFDGFFFIKGTHLVP
jgi:hypothetical protein